MRIEFYAPPGTGKTTIAKALAEIYGWKLVEEPVEDHPFLTKFYEDPRKYGFEKDAGFAIAYIHNVKKLDGENAIFDAGNLLSQSYSALTHLNGKEKAVLEGLYSLAADLPPPDLLVYLDYPADKIVERIAYRNRNLGMESDITADYIRDLQHEITQRLDATTIPVLHLDLEQLDITTRPHDIQKIARLISKKLAPENSIPAQRPLEL